MHPQLVALCLATALCALAGRPQMAQAVSFWESQFSTSEFAQYRYKDLLTVSIFQHLTKTNSFYITPLVLLDHKSGVLRYNALTEFNELRFKVIMWDAELQDSITTYLTTVRGVAHPEVKMLPIERVRFQWRSRLRPPKKVTMETEFISTHHLPQYLTLTFACKTKIHCEELHRQVQRLPEVLDSLVMDCFMTAQKAATKTVKVSVQNVAKTKVFSQLSVLPPDGNYWYMRSDDFNSLAQETFLNVRAETMRSSEYVDKYDELNIMQIIQDSLKQDEIFSSSLFATQWDSVFWDPVFARPDRVVREASSVFRKNASTNRLEVNKDYMASSEAAQKLFSGSGSSFGLGISFSRSTQDAEHDSEKNLGVNVDLKYGRSGSSGAGDSRGSTRQESFTSSELNDRLSESNLNIQWEGERFVVKPMRLVRINQREFASRRELVSHNLQLTLYQQVISLKVIIKSVHNQSSLVPEASKSAGFPTQFSYCLLSNGGSCPPGFKRSSAHMKGINLDTSGSDMIRNAGLGDSAIRCHSPGDSDNCAFRGWEPYKGELLMHVCCR